MAHAPSKNLLDQRESASSDVASKPSQSLGKWIDNLLGDKKARERAAVKAEQRRESFSQAPSR